MNKPNFKQMNRKELKKYILTHREDEEAWNEFISRPRPNSIIVPADTPPEEQEQILPKAIENSNLK